MVAEQKTRSDLSEGRKVVIVGGGFGGLAAARMLGRRGVDVTVVDRRNHNLFQPLLYQVATAALSPADIAEPIRRTLGRYPSIRVLLDEVTGVDADAHQVLLKKGGPLAYDRLVIATGSDYNYFGHDDWRAAAPGLKSVHEARLIRQRLLLAFEQAEGTDDPERRRALLTTVLIGGGPTGVELAGAISELGRFMIRRDFKRIRPDEPRVVLVEAGERLLAGFPETLSSYAQTYLEKIGIDVRLNTRVTALTEDSVTMGDVTLPAGCIAWGAGVKAGPAAQWLGIAPGPGGRVPVDAFLQVPGHPDIHVIGDTALSIGTDGRPLPALAQVAKQQGEYLGGAILESFAGQTPQPFKFHNRGNTAVVGRHAAVFDFGSWTMKGRLAWLLWAVVHVYLLVNFEKRLLVTVQWTWRYLTRQRGARIIDENME